jgi:hypothetical protein
MKRTLAVLVFVAASACVHTPRLPPPGDEDGPRKLARAAQRDLTAGDNTLALDEYREAWTRGHHDKLAAYNAACAAARLGMVDESFLWLERSADLGWRRAADWSGDDDLKPLQGDERFVRLLARAEANAAEFVRQDSDVPEPQLRKTLLDLLELDQAARRADTPSKEVAAIDDHSRAELKKILRAGGWPGKRRVGARAASAAFILAQHADQDPAFQKECLALMEAGAAAGEVDRGDVAYLTDRVLCAEGKPQRYGTQLTLVAGVLQPQPIEDTGQVDKRRRSVGLPPLEEYLEDASRILGPPKDRPVPKAR